MLAVSKMPGFGLSGLGRALMPWRCRQRWMALRDRLALTHRRSTSTMSSSGNCSEIRSSQTNRSSIAVRLVCRTFGVCGRSATVLRPRQRRIVVSLTPSSAASSATDLLLRWM